MSLLEKFFCHKMKCWVCYWMQSLIIWRYIITFEIEQSMSDWSQLWSLLGDLCSSWVFDTKIDQSFLIAIRGRLREITRTYIGWPHALKVKEMSEGCHRHPLTSFTLKVEFCSMFFSSLTELISCSTDEDIFVSRTFKTTVPFPQKAKYCRMICSCLPRQWIHLHFLLRPGIGFWWLAGP